MNKGAVVILLLVLSIVAGCGGSATPSGCSITGINVFPPAATVDHTAAPPANTKHFDAFISSAAPAGCGFQLGSLQDAVWTVSDPVNASIGNQVNVNYGTATCMNAAASPITVTATVPSDNGT